VSRVPESLPVSAFDYSLPAELIARYPAARRDESRLLVLDRATGRTEHRIFHELPGYISPGDALVLNETRVLPARLLGRKTTGAAAEVLLLRPVRGRDDVWEAMVRPGAKLRPGSHIEIAPDLSIDIIEVNADGSRVVRLRAEGSVAEAIARHGRVPLPPYIDREPVPEDAMRYQTVYARQTGSVAAPTAGLHFTSELLETISARGVHIVRIVLHVGPGTFRPVEVEDPALHPMHAESYEVPADSADTLNRVRAGGGQIWAAGTTVVRTLETVARPDGSIGSGEGETTLFIRPPYRFRAVDHLITNFHLPRSTLLMLVAAFGGYDAVMAAYREAIAMRYRFYSYGDAMVLV
jgi:S-adenosylmethionine:tRNA ribosyltransferase-isomerase